MVPLRVAEPGLEIWKVFVVVVLILTLPKARLMGFISIAGVGRA
jgi:hypothetical protein